MPVVETPITSQAIIHVSEAQIGTTSGGHIVNVNTLTSSVASSMPLGFDPKFHLPLTTSTTHPHLEYPYDVISPPTTQQLTIARSSLGITSEVQKQNSELERKVKDLQRQLDSLRLQSIQQPQPGAGQGRTSHQQITESATVATSAVQLSRFGSTGTSEGMSKLPIVSVPSYSMPPGNWGNSCSNYTPNPILHAQTKNTGVGVQNQALTAVSSSNLFGCPPVSSSILRPPVISVSSYAHPIVTPVVSQVPVSVPAVSAPISSVPVPIPGVSIPAVPMSIPNVPVSIPAVPMSIPNVPVSIPAVPEPIPNVPAPIPNRPNGGPTAQQLAARHVVPKELPIFDGNPAEWPLFYSNYTNSNQMCGYSDAENLMRLQRCLKGSALHAVSCQLLHPLSVPQVIATLQMLYGRPELVVNSLVNKVRSTPAPKADKLESVISFGLAVQNLCGHLRAMGMENHLSNPTLLQELVGKLPAGIKLDWALYQRQIPCADLRAFSDYMSSIASAASNVTFSTEVMPKQEKPKSKEKGYVNAHAEDNRKVAGQEDRKSAEASKQKQSDQPKPCAVCQKPGHKVRDCNVFKSRTIDERWKLVQQLHLCRRCLFFHGKWPCKASGCGIQGCELRHHTLLHPGQPDNTPTPSGQPSGSSAPATGNVNVHRQKPRSTLFRILPVTLYSKNSSVEVLAFLDDGSSLTLVEKDIADQLGLEGEVEPLCLQWTGNVTRTESESKVVQLGISGANCDKRYTLECARTVESLDLPPQSLNFDQMVQQFPYLRGLPIKSYSGATPRILIGLENTELLVALKRRTGRPSEPVATKTKLGWTVYGTIEGLDEPLGHRLLHICSGSIDRDLHDVVEEFFTIENTGVQAAPTVEAEDIRRAREILESTTERTASGQFETGLLWRYDHIEFPDSRPMAEQRLKCLVRRLEKTPELHEKVKQQIAAYESKGYAHRASEEEIKNFDPRRTWYLPLGVVINPNKPGKIRLIWDAAAKVDGVSFNSMLLKGPDLLTSLPAVLQRFRQRQIAVTGDIREMFHQLLMRPKDRQSQLFLWYDDPSGEIHIYVMDVATFGSTCSPCSSQYIKNLNAEEWRHKFPEAAEAIVKNHYVDDYLDSRDTVEEAARVAAEVKEVHAKAGFEIRNWLSNSNEVVQQIGGSSDPDREKSFAVDGTNGTERVLGMSWQPSSDVFTFSVRFRDEVSRLINDKVVPTKREVLRVVMSLFDPLGLVAAFVVHGKCIIQDIWRSKIGWDEKIPEEIFHRWCRWVDVLKQLDKVSIPRCYFPGYSPNSMDSLELHVFVDASEEAYACVAYFRIVDRGHVRCALVSAKSKVAPLKPLSIPRLELQAAVIGSRMAKSIEENHTLQIQRRVIWSDSSTVLSWIQSDQRKYRQFVAVRISEILDVTKIEDWRWVPTRMNVADEATKWTKDPSFRAESRWFQGPEFLYQEESEWPKKTLPTKDTAEELRPVHAHHRKAPEPMIDYSRFSKWERLLRATAFLLRYANNCKSKITDGTIEVNPILSQQELQKAEEFLWRSVQMEAFPDEVIVLGKQKHQPGAVRLEKTSPLRKLSPFLDESGVIRQDGRIGDAHYASYDARFPVILPRNHHVTRLVLDWYHRRYAHCNVATVVNEVRQKFHISNLITAVRKLSRSCNWCIVYKAIPRAPRMGPYPESRLSAYVRPFSFTGVDYCGPYYIRMGRGTVKRWVALFVCQTVRAIHLEVASSLSTESCKMAVRRFIARRGAPEQIFSDQGTNFQGARKELMQEIAAINKELAETFTNRNTQWILNPPAAPHMGGSWERLVRSFKIGLEALSTTRNPNEETFQTVIVEVEAIVNSRPLTTAPIASEEDEALTPNHFLMLSSSGVVQPAKTPVSSAAALNTNWGLAHSLLDHFWTRWVKEYLPKIRRRTKWFDDTKPIQVGDLVVIVEDDTKRNSWVRGKVVRVYPGRDGRIRVADVQTTSKVLQRAVTSLAVLEVQSSGTAGRNLQQYGQGYVEASQFHTSPEADQNSNREG